jgi:hypothetical protein
MREKPLGIEPLGIEPLGIEPLGIEPLGIEPLTLPSPQRGEGDVRVISRPRR